jgi:hypothetical protein
MAPDQTTELRKSEVRFVMKDPNINATTVTLFGNVEFKTAGTYTMEVLVDDVMKLRFPIPVIVVTPPGTATASGPAPKPEA